MIQQYTASFDPRIVGLTGTQQQIAAAAQEYGVYYARVPVDPVPTTTSWTTVHMFTL